MDFSPRCFIISLLSMLPWEVLMRAFPCYLHVEVQREQKLLDGLQVTGVAVIHSLDPSLGSRRPVTVVRIKGYLHFVRQIFVKCNVFLNLKTSLSPLKGNWLKISFKMFPLGLCVTHAEM